MWVAFKHANAPDHIPLVDPLIDRLTGGRGFCHVELLFRNAERLTALFPRGIVLNRRQEGYDLGHWTFLDVQHDEAEPFIRNWFKGEDGCGIVVPGIGVVGYDWLGLFRFVSQDLHIPALPPSGSGWWCSEVTDATLAIAGIHAGRRQLASPNSLAIDLEQIGFNKFSTEYPL